LRKSEAYLLFANGYLNALKLDGAAAVAGEWLRCFAEDLLQHELEHQAVAGIGFLNTPRNERVDLLLTEHVAELRAISYAWLTSCSWSCSAFHRKD
jgi:hypothetical protein